MNPLDRDEKDRWHKVGENIGKACTAYRPLVNSVQLLIGHVMVDRSIEPDDVRNARKLLKALGEDY